MGGLLAAGIGALVAGLAAWALHGFLLRKATSDAAILRRYLEVPIAAVLGAFAGLARTWPEALTFVVLAVAAGLLTVIDLAEERLPDAIVLPLIPVTLTLLAISAWVADDWGALIRAAVAGAVTFAVMLAMMLFSPGRVDPASETADPEEAVEDVGFGDVKLAAVTGALCGWFGWGAAALGFGAAWFTFAAVGGIRMLVLRRRSAEAGFFPFGPFLMLGAVLGIFWAGATLTW